MARVFQALWRRPQLLSSSQFATEIQAARGGSWLAAAGPVLAQRLAGDVEVRPGFLSRQEEETLCRELEPVLRRLRYERQHWDGAIHGFRETEKLCWTNESSEILQRVRDAAFPPGVPQLSLVHVLDLEKSGYIKPHIDSIKFCGSTIAGLCLLSSSVMRLVSEENQEDWADLLLERRCLYILRGRARYEFTHQILRDEDSFFNGQQVSRDRRISVICRNLPDSADPA